MLLFVRFFVCFGLVFRDRISLCSPGCPGTHSLDQVGLELRNPPASASQSTIIKGVHHSCLPLMLIINSIVDFVSRCFGFQMKPGFCREALVGSIAHLGCRGEERALHETLGAHVPVSRKCGPAPFSISSRVLSARLPF